MLQHLCIARKDVFFIEGLQKRGVENHAVRIVKHADLVFQSPEVKSRLPAYAGIYHREQGGGDVDIADTSLEGRGCKASQVGHHAAAYIY